MSNQQVLPITARNPGLDRARLLAELQPPPHFSRAAFENYRPDPAHPSQQQARNRLSQVAEELLTKHSAKSSWLRRGMKSRTVAIYLDGGFGVGKTHLLAALTRRLAPEQVAYGTFVEFTNLVGALGFAPTVQALAARKLVCIDEFELDDPGDTLLMARLLRELDDQGVSVVATSNTLPESLGEGRFAAEDFLREIQSLASRFEVLRIEGADYRHRANISQASGLRDEEIYRVLTPRPRAVVEDFTALLEHLGQVHPSRYSALLEGIGLLGITGMVPITQENLALRLVVLIDRLYDRDIPVLLGGAGTAQLFTPAMLSGGYRKKYLRALSRLSALWAQGSELTGTEPTGSEHPQTPISQLP